MSNQLERKELIHTSPSMKDEDFFSAIDATGGWPVNYKYVGFYHAYDYSGRYGIFRNNPHNDGWWTRIACADDYYWWKLSPEKKAEVLKNARQQLIAQLR